MILVIGIYNLGEFKFMEFLKINAIWLLYLYSYVTCTTYLMYTKLSFFKILWGPASGAYISGCDSQWGPIRDVVLSRPSDVETIKIYPIGGLLHGTRHWTGNFVYVKCVLYILWVTFLILYLSLKVDSQRYPLYQIFSSQVLFIYGWK